MRNLLLCIMMTGLIVSAPAYGTFVFEDGEGTPNYTYSGLADAAEQASGSADGSNFIEYHVDDTANSNNYAIWRDLDFEDVYLSDPLNLSAYNDTALTFDFKVQDFQVTDVDGDNGGDYMTRLKRISIAIWDYNGNLPYFKVSLGKKDNNDQYLIESGKWYRAYFDLENSMVVEENSYVKDLVDGTTYPAGYGTGEISMYASSGLAWSGVERWGVQTDGLGTFDADDSFDTWGIALDNVMVPEPTTLGFLLVGLTGFIYRRFK